MILEKLFEKEDFRFTSISDSKYQFVDDVKKLAHYYLRTVKFYDDFRYIFHITIFQNLMRTKYQLFYSEGDFLKSIDFKSKENLFKYIKTHYQDFYQHIQRKVIEFL